MRELSDKHQARTEQEKLEKPEKCRQLQPGGTVPGPGPGQASTGRALSHLSATGRGSSVCGGCRAPATSSSPPGWDPAGCPRGPLTTPAGLPPVTPRTPRCSGLWLNISTSCSPPATARSPSPGRALFTEPRPALSPPGAGTGPPRPGPSSGATRPTTRAHHSSSSTRGVWRARLSLSLRLEDREDKVDQRPPLRT